MCPWPLPLAGDVEDELLHAYSRVYTFDVLLLMVRLAVLVAVTLTVPIVLFPVSPPQRAWSRCPGAFQRHLDLPCATRG